jgi:hypothetical protein
MNTTDRHFQIFQKEAKRWIDKFGMQGWDIRFVHQDLAGDLNAAAFFEAGEDITNRIATIGLARSDFKRKLTAEYIKLCAFHEVCELLLHRFQYLAKARYCQEEDIDEERHNLIRIMENCVFKT